MTDKIEVTQADTDAATKAMQDFLARIYDSDTKGTDNLVEAFAAHRLAGERAGMERAAGIADRGVEEATQKGLLAESEESRRHFAAAAVASEYIAQALRAKAQADG